MELPSWVETEREVVAAGFGLSTLAIVCWTSQAAQSAFRVSTNTRFIPRTATACTLVLGCGSCYTISNRVRDAYARGGVTPTNSGWRRVPPAERPSLARLAENIVRWPSVRNTKASSTTPGGTMSVVGWLAEDAAPVRSRILYKDQRETKLAAALSSVYHCDPSRVTLGGKTELIFAIVLGCAVFAALGGRSNAFTPSYLRGVGAFGRTSHSIPATLEYATPAERVTVATMGKRAGCHTCGTRSRMAQWICDHEPPIKDTKIANAKAWRQWIPGCLVTQRFYPQCLECSQLQAKAVAVSSSDSVTHYTTIRGYHLGAMLGSGVIAEPLFEFCLRSIA